MRIKVIEVISDTNIGGAGRLLYTRMSLYDKEKFEEIVLLPKGSELEELLLNIGCSVKSVGYCEDKSFDVRAIAGFYFAFKKIKPDIVNTHGCLSARIAAYLCGVPIKIYTRHCAFDQGWIVTSKFFRYINGRVSSALSDKIIAVAHSAAQNLYDTGIDKGGVEIIINGVSPVEKYSDDERQGIRKTLGIPSNAFVCGICARLEDCKGIDTMLRAARKLLAMDKDYYFLIVGKGSLDVYLRDLCEALGISSRVKFLGFASDITPYINCFDVNLNCSRGTETSSLAISEGMSIGLPCVASDWGGNPYMVRDGYNGFIFPTDDFLALARCIEKLRKNDELYKEMSANAMTRYSEELNANKMVKETEALYCKLYDRIEESKVADVT